MAGIYLFCDMFSPFLILSCATPPPRFPRFPVFAPEAPSSQGTPIPALQRTLA